MAQIFSSRMAQIDDAGRRSGVFGWDGLSADHPFEIAEIASDLGAPPPFMIAG
jgi:hypothetical protein